MHCSSCGAKVSDGTAFCGACGRPIVGYSVGGSSSIPAVAPSMPAALPPPYAPAAVSGVAYAGFWLRAVAAIIDGIVIGIPLTIVAILMFASALPTILAMGHAAAPNPMLLVGVFLPRLLFLGVAYVIGSWLYWARMESSSWQATLGKKALGLYVTDLNGQPAPFGKTTGRFFAGRGIGVVPYVGGLYFLVSCILAGFTEKKQALHDIIAGTLVLRRV